MLASLFIGGLLVLAATACLGLRGDVLHPAIVFPAVWGAAIILLGLAAPFGYFQLSAAAFLVFVVGAFCFAIGALVAGSMRVSPKEIGADALNYKKIAWACVALHAVMLPLSWREIEEMVSGSKDIWAAAYYLRSSAVSGEESVGPVVGNYLLVGLLFVPMLMTGWMRKKIWFWVLLSLSAPWVLLIIFVNGRSNLVFLILALAYIYFSLGGRMSFRAGTVFALAFVAVLVVGNLLVGKIDAGIDDAWLEVFAQSAKGFFDYLLQGPILFSRYFEDPSRINPTWDALIFPCHVLEKFNLCVRPPLHQDFMAFSVRGDLGNVYSIFFSIYPKYGWFGIVLIMFLYGCWAGFHHARRDNGILHLLMGGFLFSAALLSVFSDMFGANAYFFLKLLFIVTGANLVFRKT
ncbi:O-antigen polymerase [Variovorax sp. JS1663]|uniref:O-antigen polymerase n=1 Tax=Variovorax sp. JS1663 TaxID=1851577 RepID=UPI000B34855A|nr:O-antigen polymerase [Variovorax sp. JS1663]OUL99434.1 hypothetical protein A8M77_26545 [Variovorax sp. JS1663]